MAATMPGRLTPRWQGAGATHGDRQTERRHEGLRRPAAPLGGRAHLFSWFGRNRRLAKDLRTSRGTLATFVTLASIQLALRRLARAPVRGSPPSSLPTAASRLPHH